FDAFNTQDSYNVLIFMLVSFLLGLLLAYILRGATIRRLRKELRQEKKMTAEARADLEQAKSQLDLKTAEWNKANFELGEAQTRLAELDAEKSGYVNQIYGLNTRVEELQGSQLEYDTTIDVLNAEIAELKANTGDAPRVAELEAENAQLRQEIADLTKALADTRVGSGSRRVVASSTSDDVLSRLDLLENKLRQLENENSTLRSSIGTFEDGADYHAAGTATRGTSSRGVTADEPSSDEAPDPDLHIGTDKRVLAIVPPELIEDRDDLTQIEGVGTFLQQKLYDEGYYTYAAIANLSSAEIEELTGKIGYLPGRIEKDDWVGQAKKLMAAPKKADKKSTKKTTKKKKSKADNLKVIEGIGPKIEGLLKDAGIKTLDQLAKTPVDDIKAVLTKAGDRYRIHDPGTWPSQARLAANEEWDLLKQYQDDLDGGKPK
ncbi:MAG: helix-hairpin-helix domain-containing protein, partial [Bacteroidota bacterium]